MAPVEALVDTDTVPAFEPTVHALPCRAARVAGPAGPCAPVAPCGPGMPCGPAGPAGPCGPGAPAGPLPPGAPARETPVPQPALLLGPYSRYALVSRYTSPSDPRALAGAPLPASSEAPGLPAGPAGPARPVLVHATR